MKWRGAVAVSALVLLSATLGCKSQGKYTSSSKDAAQDNIDRIHAGTEFDQAKRQYRLGDFDRALESVERSISYVPDVAKCHLLRGKILIELGRHPDAIDSLEYGSLFDPENPEFPYLCGVVHEQMGWLDLAYDDFSFALSLNEQEPSSRLALAEVLVQLERVDEAKELLKSSSGWSDGEAGFRQTLGHIALLEGDQAEAHRLFGEAAILSPQDPGILEDLFRVQVEANEFAEAIRTIRNIEETAYYESRTDVQRLHALCLIQIRKPVEARAILRKLVEGEGEVSNFETWRLMSEVALLLEDDYLLSSAASRMVQAEPGRSEGFLARAVAQRREGDLDGALKSVRSAVSLAGDDPTPSKFEALILEELTLTANTETVE